MLANVQAKNTQKSPEVAKELFKNTSQEANYQKKRGKEKKISHAINQISSQCSD